MMRTTWIGAWVPLLVNGVLLVIPTPANGSIAEAIDPVGKTFLVIWGGLTFAVGLVGSILGVTHDHPQTANGYNIADAVLAPLPNLTQFLRYNSAVEGSDGITLAIKLIVNDVADIAVGFLQAEAK
jgi:hypothetical protein